MSRLHGAFVDSLKRNNAKIREDRAQAISEDVELIYKRAVEDITVEIRALERERENMLDMSPDNTFSIIKADAVDAKAFTEKDMEIGVKLRNLRIKQEIAQSRYTYLFGTAREDGAAHLGSNAAPAATQGGA